MADVIDRAALDELVAMTGGDRAFLDELIDTFSTDAAGLLADLEAAADSGDDAAMMRPAHSLKSNAASFGAHRLAELCRSVEHDAREGGVLDADARVAAIRDELVSVEAALQAERESGS
jgi:HPt (histidine-containing phosphotransfer) domain-containing protein